MEIRQLEAFAAVMSAGSITAAGRLLGRSQPAVTRSIQELEAEIGYPLFQRFGPRVAPTREASQLYQDVERTLANLRQVKVRAEQIARQAPPPVTLAATSALAVGLVPRALSLLDRSHPLESVHLRSAAPEQVVNMVLNGIVDIGVSSLPPEHRGVLVHILRNTLIPLITVIGLEFGSTIAFAVVTETVFAWPGAGKLILDSINALDRPVILSYLIVVVCMFVSLNLLVDILYKFLDPRVRLEGTR